MVKLLNSGRVIVLVDKEITSVRDQEFVGVDYAYQELSGKEFENCHFQSCDFSDALFSNCEFTDCRFSECNLSILDVTNSKFSDVSFVDCKMVGVNWTHAYWRDLSLASPISFERCMINASSFYGLNLEKIKIIECRAHDVDFREANLRGVDFSNTDLLNGLFNQTTLVNANFVGAQNYDLNIRLNRVEGACFCRYEAVNLLVPLGIKFAD